MSEKQDLAILFSLLGKSTEEYVSSQAFKRLENETEIIKNIEKFRLPEVNKLIGCSLVYRNLEWTKPYDLVSRIYTDGDNWEPYELLLKYVNDPNEFEEEIVSVAGLDIIYKIKSYFEKNEMERDKLKKERTSLKGKITKAKKKMTENNGEEEAVLTSEEAISQAELRIEELNKLIEDKEFFIKGYKKHCQIIKKYSVKYENVEQMALLREKAYAVIDEIKPSREEEFLVEYIRTGELSNEYNEELKNYGFVQRFLECLDKKNYRELAFPVLDKLCKDSVLKFENELVCLFVNTHTRLLAEYLEDKYKQDKKFLADEDSTLLMEYAIKNSINGCNDFITWWNTLETSADWELILMKVKEIYGCPIEANVAKLLHHVEGKSLNAFVELVQRKNIDDNSFSSSEVILEYIEQESPDLKDLVSGYLRNIEQTNRKLKRKLASKEREVNRFGSDLFSSIYFPLEQLESLAVNLRLSNGKIKCSLVAGQMIEQIAALREGLAAMGLGTADEIETWQEQSFVNYDMCKHRMSSPIIDAKDRVRLQTMGYSYVDDDGNEKIRAAEVYIPAPEEEKKDTDYTEKEPGYKTYRIEEISECYYSKRAMQENKSNKKNKKNKNKKTKKDKKTKKNKNKNTNNKDGKGNKR